MAAIDKNRLRFLTGLAETEAKAEQVYNKAFMVCSSEEQYTLLNDLDDRGLLETTLVITAGEFGRTPKLKKQARGPGRDHWGRCFSLTMGGGGVKTGRLIGASDKYDESGSQFPNGYAEPDRKPLYPQRLAEIMALAIPQNPGKDGLVEQLGDCVIGPQTAAEMNWIAAGSR